MKYGFDTSDEAAATAALLVYATWRSRDAGKLRVTPDIWSQVERFVKDASKRSKTLPAFLESLKPRVGCGALKPRWMRVGLTGEIPLAVVSEGGKLSYAVQVAPDEGAREFMTTVLEQADAKAVLARLHKETAWVVLLVRDRLEREKPVEDKLNPTTEEAA